MALARNLDHNKIKSRKITKPGSGNKIRLGLVFFGVCILVFGAISLFPHMRLGTKQKEEIKLETGDRPLPKTISIWITADKLTMRQSPDINSKPVFYIPKGTKVEATELEGEWYKINYLNKEGWVNKNYVSIEAPVQNPTKNWRNYSNKEEGYTVRYPQEWVVQDYGKNPATQSDSYVAFGSQLPAEIDASEIPPIIIRTTLVSISEIETNYKKKANSVVTSVRISGLTGKKVIFSSENGVEMTAYFVSKGPKVFIIEESGGYATELGQMIVNLNLA